jgi:hypothetical protein
MPAWIDRIARWLADNSLIVRLLLGQHDDPPES